MLSLENISFGYNENVTALYNVSFNIKKGEFVALCGRNGSGKTTLSRIVMGMEKLDQGRILFEDTDITKYNITERSNFISYVFQNPDRQIFSSTVREEIAFGPTEKGENEFKIKEIVEDLLIKLDLKKYENAYPLSLPKSIKQKIAIASSLSINPQILILDEPTSGQDPKETKELMELLAKLHKEGLTIILITHNMEIVAKFAERILVLEKGNLAYNGPTSEFFTKNNQVENLGLDTPLSVVLGKKYLDRDFTKSIDEFTKLYIEAKEKDNHDRKNI